MRRYLTAMLACFALLLLPGCVKPAPAAPAESRTGPPPWPAPRDAISYIDAARLRHVRLDAQDHKRIFQLSITIDGHPIPVSKNIGIDRIRAVQAPVHTHDDSGQIWLEGEGSDEVTLGSFFTVWGVKFDRNCLGSACQELKVLVDGKRVTEPLSFPLVKVQQKIEISAQT